MTETPVLSAERSEIIKTTLDTFTRRFYEPSFGGIDIPALIQAEFDKLLVAADFEERMNEILGKTGAYPTVFVHESRRTIPAERLLMASLHEWRGGLMFQDVHTDGAADRFGIQPGDTLLRVNDRDAASSKDTLVSPRSVLSVTIRRSGEEKTFTYQPPVNKSAGNSKIHYVTAAKPAPSVGYLKVSMFPGILGIDIARDIDRAIKSLKGCSKLIVDLRGNLGSSGAGNLRLMSYLTPDRMPVGYSLTRRRAQEGYRREDLAQFTRIPRNKLTAPFVLWKFRKVDKSIVIVTEGLGRQQFHGRIVMLINEHTTSGGEIVAGFASDHKLATLVGSPTKGTLLAFSTFPVGGGYQLTIPVANYLTWEGGSYERAGVHPSVSVPFEPDAALECKDNQLEAVLELTGPL